MSYKMMLSGETQEKLQEIAPKCQELFSGDISKDLAPERKQTFIELSKIAREEMTDHYGMISKNDFIKAMKEYGIPGKAASLAMEAAEYKSWKNRTPEEKEAARKEIRKMIENAQNKEQLNKSHPAGKLDKELSRFLDEKPEPEKAVDKDLEYLKRLAKEMDQEEEKADPEKKDKDKEKGKEKENEATLETRKKTLAANIATKCRSIGMEDEECESILTHEMGLGAKEAKDILDDEIALDDVDPGYAKEEERDFLHEWLIAMMIRYEQEVRDYEKQEREKEEEEMTLEEFSAF